MSIDWKLSATTNMDLIKQKMEIMLSNFDTLHNAFCYSGFFFLFDFHQTVTALHSRNTHDTPTTAKHHFRLPPEKRTKNLCLLRITFGCAKQHALVTKRLLHQPVDIQRGFVGLECLDGRVDAGSLNISSAQAPVSRLHKSASINHGFSSDRLLRNPR